MAYIYKITNDINDKVYVGKTNLSLEDRFKEHCRDSRRQRKEHRPLYAAMRKHGCEAFHISLIEECPIECAAERECYWIGFFDGFVHGYNATKGGDGKLRFDHDEIVEKQKAHPYAIDVAKEVGCSKYTVYNIAKAHNIALANRSQEELSKRKRKVEQIDRQGNLVNCFESVVEAGRWCQSEGLTADPLCSTHIFHCALGQRKTAYGYRWKYVN